MNQLVGSDEFRNQVLEEAARLADDHPDVAEAIRDSKRNIGTVIPLGDFQIRPNLPSESMDRSGYRMPSCKDGHSIGSNRENSEPQSKSKEKGKEMIENRSEMIKAIEKVVKHWKGKDSGAEWIQPLKHNLKREHQHYAERNRNIRGRGE